MSEPKGMSRRTSWTLIICSVVLGLTLPIGAYGAVGTVFNLSDASRTGPDGDARILNNKLGTTLCDVRTTGVTTANCVKVSAGRLLTVGQEPPNPFSRSCLISLSAPTIASSCSIASMPAKYVIESIQVRGEHGHGVDMLSCHVFVPQAGGDPHPVHVGLEWVGTRSGTARFLGSQSVHLHGVKGSFGLSADCDREAEGTVGYFDIDVAGYSY